MAVIQIDSTNGWSYNGEGKYNSIAKFTNPDSKLKASISSIEAYLGTIKGTCTWGRNATGNGTPFYTDIEIDGIVSNSKYIDNVVGIKSGDGGYYPDRAQIQKSYIFTFNTPVIIQPKRTVDINIKCPSTGDGHVIAFNGVSSKSNGHYVTITYELVPDKQPTPSAPTISLQSNTSFTATSIDFTVTCSSKATHCDVYLDGSKVKSNATMSNNRYSGSVTVSRTTNTTNGNHRLYAFCRNDNSDWSSASNQLYVDCTVPSIYNASITPKSSNSGTLSFTSNYNVNYSLDNSTVRSVNKNTNPQATVTLISNDKTHRYLLEVKRQDNTKITNSTYISGVNTTPPNIVLTYEVYGTTCYITAKADCQCSNWVYTWKVKGSSSSSSKSVNTTGTSISAVIEKLDPGSNGQTYEIVVTAKKVENGITGESNKVFPEIIGGVEIFDEIQNKYKSATIYVWLNGEWRRCLPYVYETSSNRWKLGW